jgi:hypothetical protein
MTNTHRIRELNDTFRTTLRGGRVLVTSGISDRSDLALIMEGVRQFANFQAGNDPYNEHDFGAIRIGADHIFWKIDYYDADLSSGSPDPSDPAVTSRVLTVMLGSEY